MIKPPVAERRPVSLRRHGETRLDDYYWLRERNNPQVVDYLKAENAYTEAILAGTDSLQETLYQEIRERLREDDASAPVFDNGYWYYYRYATGEEYPCYFRRHRTLEADEELVLDVRELAGDGDYLDVRGLDISSDNRWLVFAMDTTGRRLYSLHVRDLQSGELTATGIEKVSPDPHWANDNQHLFFVKKDPDTLRENEVWRVAIDAGVLLDTPFRVYREDDEQFSVELGRTKRWDYLCVVVGSTVSTEYWLIDANKPEAAARLFHRRERDHEYYLDFDGQTFFLLSNFEAPNFRLMSANGPEDARHQWQEIVAHRSTVYLEDFEIMRSYFVLEQKHEGLTQLEVIERESARTYLIDFPDAAFSCSLNDNCEYDSTVVRFGFESMITPDSTIDYDLRTRSSTVVLQDEVGGGFSSENYCTERLWVSSADGTRVPVSLCWHKDTPRDGTAPLLQYGYGAYGYSLDADFSYSRISLLDRGFVYAIAHVRGGSELGRHWYDAGRLAAKKNTFDDFIAVTDALRDQGRVDPASLFASGGSAGGLLIGAVINLRPALYRGVIADVPFVDVLTTMLDDSLPLTTGEYDEWGDPNDPSDYAQMRAYSPYDNLVETAYPNVLVLAGLHDSQVQYWEPAKWAAKLRAYNQGSNDILLYTNMDAGHGGSSGRFEAIRETALAYAFVLQHAGIVSS